MTAKNASRAKGRTASARCATPGCRGSARPGHASTATHRAAVWFVLTAEQAAQPSEYWPGYRSMEVKVHRAPGWPTKVVSNGSGEANLNAARAYAQAYAAAIEEASK